MLVTPLLPYSERSAGLPNRAHIRSKETCTQTQARPHKRINLRQHSNMDRSLTFDSGTPKLNTPIKPIQTSEYGFTLTPHPSSQSPALVSIPQVKFLLLSPTYPSLASLLPNPRAPTSITPTSISVLTNVKSARPPLLTFAKHCFQCLQHGILQQLPPNTTAAT